ncbi:MAG: fumarate hydratase [Oscillospiraceae bacterium]|nr:fumarate hydratase [Oscillospiraceae bacterium]
MMTDGIVSAVKETLITAGSTFSEDKIRAYQRAIAAETNERAKWVLETILENGKTAAKNRTPLCDDSGIPHIVLEVGKNRAVTGEMLDAIYQGVAEGLREMPGRPMAVMGSDWERIDQSGGLDPDPGALAPAPLLMHYSDVPDRLRVHIAMFGGGPAIRGKTYRVFHKHSAQVVKDEIVSWASEAVAQLGCSPCTLTIGIGRSHYEAASLMLKAQVFGNHDVQSEAEQEITRRVNETNIGVLGLHGDTSVLSTFLQIGPQRASGVRVVCMRPSCCFEPRHAYTDL